jgi:hypothetical protein
MGMTAYVLIVWMGLMPIVDITHNQFVTKAACDRAGAEYDSHVPKGTPRHQCKIYHQPQQEK